MARQPEYQGLRDALDEGVKSLRKWYGRVESTSPGYFVCLGKCHSLLFWLRADDTCQSLTPMSRTCSSRANGATSITMLA
jgi:hypothetical protein